MRRSSIILLLAILFGGVHNAAAADRLRYFHAELVPDEETFPVESNGRGHAEFVLDLETLRLSWKVNYTGLTSRAISARIHGPAQMFTNGIAFLDLAPKGMTTPLEGSATVTDAQVQYMISTWAFINIATERYKDGEIRGQLDGKTVE